VREIFGDAGDAAEDPRFTLLVDVGLG